MGGPSGTGQTAGPCSSGLDVLALQGALDELAVLLVANRITTFLRQRLATLDYPRSTGKALTGPQLGTYWRYRVGDYRIICDIQDEALCILVIEVGNRWDIYW